jgi:hypothetical protein
MDVQTGCLPAILLALLMAFFLLTTPVSQSEEVSGSTPAPMTFAPE